MKPTLLSTTFFLCVVFSLIQATRSEDDALLARTTELLRSGSIDDAEALIRKRTIKAKQAETAEALLKVANARMNRKDPAAAEELFQELIEKYPNEPTTVPAYFGLTRILQANGNWEKMQVVVPLAVEAQRADAVKAIAAKGRAFNARSQHKYDLHLYAGDWKGALRSLDEAMQLRPLVPGLCATCDAYTRMQRRSRQTWCLIQLDRHTEAASTNLDALTGSSLENDDVLLFLLVRLYKEAGQLDDLRRINLALADSMRATIEADLAALPESDRARGRKLTLKRIDDRARIVDEAIELARSTNPTQHIETIRPEPTHSAPRILRHIAYWKLSELQNTAVPRVIRAAHQEADEKERTVKYGHGELLNKQFLRALVIIDSRAARAGLAELAERGSMTHHQAICGAMKERLEEPLNFVFYGPWPEIAEGSLPKKLPPELLKE